MIFSSTKYMKQNTTIQGSQSRYYTTLNRMWREGISQKVTFEPTPKS